MVATFFKPGERGLHRRLGRVLVLDDLAEHVLLLELSPRRFLEREDRDREQPAREPEHEERPAPTFDATRPGRAIAPTTTGLRLPRTCWPMFIAADMRARMPIG